MTKGFGKKANSKFQELPELTPDEHEFIHCGAPFIEMGIFLESARRPCSGITAEDRVYRRVMCSVCFSQFKVLDHVIDKPHINDPGKGSIRWR